MGVLVLEDDPSTNGKYHVQGIKATSWPVLLIDRVRVIQKFHEIHSIEKGHLRVRIFEVQADEFLSEVVVRKCCEFHQRFGL